MDSRDEFSEPAINLRNTYNHNIYPQMAKSVDLHWHYFVGTLEIKTFDLNDVKVNRINVYSVNDLIFQTVFA